jgi:hypothetical protein
MAEEAEDGKGLSGPLAEMGIADAKPLTALDDIDEIGVDESTPLNTLPPSRQEKLEGDDFEQLIRLKRVYGIGILGLMFLQLAVINATFLLYAAMGYDWAPPSKVMQIWLVVTFAQVVSVVVVITRSLFPGEKSESALLNTVKQLREPRSPA